MKLTKSVIDKILPPQDQPQFFYRDDLLKGFGLRVTNTGVKSFVVERRIHNKVRRITIGRFGPLTVEQARKEAQKLLGKIATGINPTSEKQVNQMRSLTLEEVLQDYLKSRKDLKPATALHYKNLLKTAFDKWKDRPLLSITKDKVEHHHSDLGQTRGPAYANLAMRLLRALFNFAAGRYEDAQGRSLIVENPVKRLSQTRAWYRVDRRQTFIKSHELATWHSGVMQLQNEIFRDYLLFVLFTGLRRQEAAKLKWEEIDFKAKTLKIADTKNKFPHTLPLSNYLYELLIRHKQTAISDYVFHGTGKEGYVVEPRRQVTNVIKNTGIQFTVHDLRRTFITAAESLDIPAYALKRLLNHKMNNDVTAGYIMTDVERLRKPMQQISDYLVACIGEKI